MSGVNEELQIAITTKAELAGAQEIEQSLERQIGKAKALGKDYSELAAMLATVRTNIKQAAVETDQLTDADKRATTATAQLSEEAAKSSKIWGESKHEIKEAANELGRAFELSGLGKLAIGGVAMAAYGAAKAVEFLKDTWEGLKETIKGPIEVGLPSNAVEEINAAAEAWQNYAEAKARAIEIGNSPEAQASEEEKKLTKQIDLIHQLLKAQEEQALATLKLQKENMTPEAYAAAEDRIKGVFSDAGSRADSAKRKALVGIKEDEIKNLESDARSKTERALSIKAAPESVAAANQKALDENAANGEKAKEEIKQRLDLINRVQRGAGGQFVPEYEGISGKFNKYFESQQLYQRYGPMRFDEMRDIENPRLAQAQASIDRAENYRRRQQTNSTERRRLMTEAGTESGKARLLSGEVVQDRLDNARQDDLDRSLSLAGKATAAVSHAASAGAHAGSQEGHQDAVSQLMANQKLGRELAGAAKAAAESHSESLGILVNALNQLRAANAQLSQRISRVEGHSDLH